MLFGSLPAMPVRRAFTLVLIGLLAVSCSGGQKNPLKSLKFVSDWGKGDPTLKVVGLGPGSVGSSDDPLPTGWSVVSFQIMDASGKPIEGGQPYVHTAKADWVLPLGPFGATWTPFTGYDKTGDTSPKSSATGIYWARIQIANPGPWYVVVTSPTGLKGGTAKIPVVASDSAVAPVGSKAVSVKTPVATTKADLAKVCTRQPPDPMHSISLDAALKNGKPTVAVFSSPGKSESKLGSQVTDEVMLVDQKYGPDKANFVHVEEFPPGSPSPSLAFKAWGLTTEPWVFVIDGKGVIRGRFAGAATAPMIEKSLKRLL
jgi:hypothetical protein